MQAATGVIASPDISEAKQELSNDLQHAFDFSKVPQLASLGAVFKSSPCKMLTESETEYSVRLTKHVFAAHFVFQYECTNTMNDVVLEEVVMQMAAEMETTGFLPSLTIPIGVLVFGTPQSTFNIYERHNNSCPTGNLISGTNIGDYSCTLSFKVKDCDPETGIADQNEIAYSDTYQIDKCTIHVGDYIVSQYISDFEVVFSGMQNECVETFVLPQPSLDACLLVVTEILGMTPIVEGASGEESRRVHMSGVFVGVPCLVKLRMVFESGVGATVEVVVRSGHAGVSRLICDGFQ